MNLQEYDSLCAAHAFPRIDDNRLIAAQEIYLITLARDHGDPFKHTFNVHYERAWGIPFFKFPVATTANEQHKNTDTMNIQVNLTADQQILDAINNLAAAISNKPSQCGSAPVVGIPATLPEPASTEEAPDTTEEPKKVKAKKTPAPKTVEPEPEPEIQVPTGPELKERVSPLKGTAHIQKLRDYMDNDLGLKGTGLAVVTDTEALKKIDEKITQLLKAAAEDDV